MILFAFGVFTCIILYLFAGVIWAVFCMIVSCIWEIVVSSYQSIFVKSKLNESGFTEKKLLEQRLEAAAEQRKHDDEILGQHNRIIKAALNAVNEMRIKYPYADEDLYTEYRQKFAAASVRQIQEIEEKIRTSHLKNEINYSVYGKQETKYTLADLNGISSIEEKREDPLIMRIFKIGSDYLLHINNIDNCGQYLLQSKDYFVIARVQVKILEEQRKLREMKKNIESHQVNDIFSNVVYTTESFRRNRMGFID